MKRLGLLAALLLMAGGLGGCLIVLQPPVNPIPEVASTSNANPVDTVTVPANSTLNFDVALPAGVMSYPLITFELDPGVGGPNLNLSLISYTSYVTLASSSSPDSFAQGTLGLASLSTAATAVSRQGINANQVCYSSCILWPTNASHYYLSIQNLNGYSVTVDLYAYAQNYNDSNELGGNNGFTSAVPLASGGDTGAIETIGDNDFWNVSSLSGGTLSFTAVDNTTPVGLAVDVYDSSYNYVGSCYTTNPCSIPVIYGDYLDVYSDNYRAGPSGTSGYTISY